MNYQDIIVEVFRQCGLDVLDRPDIFFAALQDISEVKFEKENKLFKKSLNAHMLKNMHEAAKRGLSMSDAKDVLIYRLKDEEGLSQETAEMIAGNLTNAICAFCRIRIPAGASIPKTSSVPKAPVVPPVPKAPVVPPVPSMKKTTAATQKNTGTAYTQADLDSALEKNRKPGYRNDLSKWTREEVWAYLEYCFNGTEESEREIDERHAKEEAAYPKKKLTSILIWTVIAVLADAGMIVWKWMFGKEYTGLYALIPPLIIVFLVLLFFVWDTDDLNEPSFYDSKRHNPWLSDKNVDKICTIDMIVKYQGFCGGWVALLAPIAVEIWIPARPVLGIFIFLAYPLGILLMSGSVLHRETLCLYAITKNKYTSVKATVVIILAVMTIAVWLSPVILSMV